MTVLLRFLVGIAAALLLFAPARLASQWTRPDSGVRVYLITAGPGGNFFTWFGHTALIVADARRKADYWYDYGIIEGTMGASADQRRGAIRARVVRSASPRARLHALETDDREVELQELLLAPDQADSLVALLEADVSAFGTAGYAYRHTGDNCTTRIRDVLDRATGGALRRAVAGDVAGTVRDEGYRRVASRNMAMGLLGDVLTGRTIDQRMTRWDALFLPAELARAATVARLAREAPFAVTRFHVLSHTHVVPVQVPSHGWLLAAIGAMLAAAVLLFGVGTRHHSTRARELSRTMLGTSAALAALLLGLLGCGIVYGWTMTAFTLADANENILLANPLALFTLPFAVAYATGSQRARRPLVHGWTVLAASAALALAAKALPSFTQQNWRIIALVLPVIIGLAAALRVARPEARQTETALRPESLREPARAHEREGVHP
ncbi:DUF4105 domain-containing protein [Gemmatimonas sp.]|uniref:lipoprotein N-acyltransferase Lnb domain-containing protein n=1 Tax=Gemmatimonas sp. TaxID=1962908 RepID=UPI0039834E22